MKPTVVALVQHHALLLRNADPDAYQGLLAALDAYATEITVAVTDAPAEVILNMQGRAKQTLVMLNMLRNPKPFAASPSP